MGYQQGSGRGLEGGLARKDSLLQKFFTLADVLFFRRKDQVPRKGQDPEPEFYPQGLS
jgi:hypothetical protein